MTSNTNCSKGNKSQHISSAQVWKKVQTMVIRSRLCKDQKLNVKTQESKYRTSKKDKKSNISPVKFFTED